jgi:hypothetical protein
MITVIECFNCGVPYEPTASHWMCLFCGMKDTCCEGEPQTTGERKLNKRKLNTDKDFRKSVYVGSYPPGKVRISLAQGCRQEEARMVPADQLFGASAILELSNEHAWSLLTQLADIFGAKLRAKP